MNSLRNIFANFLPRPKEKRDSNRSMGKKSKESLKLFGSHAAPTGWGYLSGGRSILTPYKEAQSKLRWRQGSKKVLDICFVSWMYL